MSKKEATVVIRNLGSHGWEDIAYCKPYTLEYVFQALCSTYPNWKLIAQDNKGNVYMSKNVDLED